VEFLAIEGSWSELQVGATAVDALLVLHGVLHHEGLILVTELLGDSGDSVELCVLRGLQTQVGGIAVNAGCCHEFAEVVFVLGLNPP